MFFVKIIDILVLMLLEALCEFFLVVVILTAETGWGNGTSMTFFGNLSI
tara:strand:+ start:402 stop:548 length:147 start_codon:yes stop_codon:yes gene_type:complete